MPLTAHARAALRNAFRSPGARRFGLPFSIDYLRMAARAAGAWGDTGAGDMRLLGFRLPFPNQSHALALLHEVFVHAPYDFSARSLRPRIVDCGANIGLSVLFFKACAPDASIVAIEAEPSTYAWLRRLVDANGFTDVDTINAAVAAEDGTVTLYASPDDPGGMLASLDPGWGGSSPRDVRAIRLSSIITGPIDFLKLDVEGAEYAVIDDLVARDRLGLVNQAAIECHDVSGNPAARDRLIGQLERSGFSVELRDVDPARRLALIRATRT